MLFSSFPWFSVVRYVRSTLNNIVRWCLKSPRFVPYLHIGVRCLACDRKSPPQKRNVGKYFRKEVNLVTNLLHKLYVYHPKSIIVQQSFHLGRRATLYPEGFVNVNRNLHFKCRERQRSFLIRLNFYETILESSRKRRFMFDINKLK